MTNPTEEPTGDRGNGDKTWSPDHGEQGISNRPDDESDRLPTGGGITDEADDKFAFGNDDEELEENEDEEEDDDEDDDEEQEENERQE